jgi:hypothetical protein
MSRFLGIATNRTTTIGRTTMIDTARRHAHTLLAALLAAAATAGVALASGEDDDRRGRGHGSTYDVGLWGDVPYSDQQETSGVPNLVADMNRADVAFSVHDGDIKSGSSRCDDEVYEQFEGYLDSLRAPAMYTPGDNEWTDCDRENNGAFDSAERLAHIRENLFDTPYSHGRHPIRQEVQAPPYVENRRWQVGKVTYATLHVVGSDNNRSGDVAPDPAEWAARDEATNEWLREAFAAAERRHSAGVMLVIQGNPGFDGADPTRAPARDPATLAPEDGFFNFLDALREETIAYGKPVVLVHGDSHYFRLDKPLLDAAGNRIENFTRLETPGDNAQSGDNDVQWVRVTVDPRDPEVFSYQQEVVSANLPEYVP